MTKPLVIAFGFAARSGKGECCDTIYKQHSLEHGGKFNIFRVSFAQHLRDEIHEAMFEVWLKTKPPRRKPPMRLLCESMGVEYDPYALIDDLNPYGKQRKLQQFWGTEYRRAQSPTYWVDYVSKQIRVAAPDIVLVDDLRFKNEADWIAKMGGVTVKTNREGLPPITDGIPGHISESALANHSFDYYITARDGQLPWLRQQALNLFDFITK